MEDVGFREEGDPHRREEIRSFRATCTGNRLPIPPRRLLCAAIAHWAPMGEEHSLLNWLQKGLFIVTHHKEML